MKRIVFCALAFAMAVGVSGQMPLQERTLLRNYNLNGTSYVYSCLAPPQNGPANMKNASSSSTITTASSVVTFANLSQNDIVQVIVGTTTSYLTVQTISPDQKTITVDTAIDLSGNGASGYRYQFQKFTTGSSDGTCWQNVGNYLFKTFVVAYEQGDYTGGIDFDIECKSNGDAATPVRVYPQGSSDCGGGPIVNDLAGSCNIHTVSAGTMDGRFSYTNTFSNYGWCRVGLKGVGTDTSDVGSAIEKINVFLAESTN